MTDGQRDALVQILKDNMQDGLFSYQWNGETYHDVDTAAAALAALAPYCDTDAEAKAVVEQILAALKTVQQDNGSFGNANADAMVIIGLLAAGENPFAWKAASGASVVDGMLSYVNEETLKFTYGGSDNALATEQGFRALIALEKYDGQNAYNFYDFGNAAVSPGHATGQGTVEVPPAPDDSHKDITVSVSVESHNGIWMEKKTVTVKEGSTVYHAFVKALDGSGITQVGAEKGYVKSMTKDGVTLGEMTMGANSGWLYKVNGILPDRGLTSYEIKQGDEILWYYTADYQKDPSAGGIIGGGNGDDTDIEEPDTPLDPLPSDEIIAAVRDAKIKLTSALTTLHGKKAVKLTWKVPTNVDALGLDGYEVFKSTKRYSGFGKTPYFKTTRKTYINNKELKKGSRYYYKVRGYKQIDEQKIYTQWSTKAWRTIK